MTYLKSTNAKNRPHSITKIIMKSLCNI